MSQDKQVVSLNVVAGILCAADNQVLIAERLGDGPFHGLWEFPGGKIAADESATAALRRELDEEIGVTARKVDPFMHLQHDYPDRHVDIRFFLVTDWHGEPSGLEGQKLRWVAIPALGDEPLLPADRPVVQALQALPARPIQICELSGGGAE